MGSSGLYRWELYACVCTYAPPHAYQVGSGDLKRWKACVAAMEKTGAKWGDETTVGAGLPSLTRNLTLTLTPHPGP